MFVIITRNQHGQITKKRKVIAAGDQGANKPLVVADSEGNIYLPCKRLDNFCELLKKKIYMKNGSKNFADIKKNITNTINAVINQLILDVDFIRLSVFYLEDVRYMGKGTYHGRFLKGFVHGQIRKKLQSICDLYGVQLKMSPSRYKSQRCSSCGFTHKKNRKSQAEFKCCSCSYEDNADVNSCRNHLDRGLIGIRKEIKESRTTGFFWNKKKIVICEEFAVKPTKRKVRKQKENASLTVM